MIVQIYKYMSAESPLRKSYEQNTPIEDITCLSKEDILRTKNSIQVALMEDCGIERGDHVGMLAWVQKYAADFSDYLHAQPQLILDWHNGKEDVVLEALVQAEAEGFPHQNT